MIKLACIKSNGYHKGMTYTLIEIIDPDGFSTTAVIDTSGMIYPYNSEDFISIEKWREMQFNKLFS